jgi:hypothetical protein
MSQNKPLAENYVHVYQGVRIAVHINYIEGIITLIDENPKNPSAVQGKQWIFRNRSLDYMGGWLEIMDAMKSAVSEAADKLKAYQDQEEAEKMALITDALKERV